MLLDHLLGREDRMEAARRQAALIEVRDQVLRYELEYGSPPKSLGVLVPGYLRRNQIERDGRPLYEYDPEKRLIGQREGTLVRGLRSYRLSPVTAELPTPQGKTGRAVQKPSVTEKPTKTSLWTPARLENALEPPPGSFVFEAEHFTATNYGWEIHPDPECSGGAYLHCKEGTGNTSGQTLNRMGDFYNIHSTSELTYLRYHLHVPKSGVYKVYGRMWTTGAHCSNYINVAVDRGGPEIGGMGNTTPFRWVWSRMNGGPAILEAGDHFIHVFMHEDGIRLDQFLMTRSSFNWGGGEIYRTNFEPGRKTNWEITEMKPVQISFDLKSMIITQKMLPECRVVLRRLRPSAERAQLRVVLHSAASGGAELLITEQEIELAELPEISFLPLDFKSLPLSELPRREFLLKAELKVGDKLLSEVHQPLMKPFQWEVLGPLEFLSNDEPGPCDADSEPESVKNEWNKLKDSSWDHYGVMDWGLHAIGNSLHAPDSQTIYARTRIRVPAAGDYLFKIQADDQMLLWLDGKQIYRHDYEAPVTRAAYRIKVHLEKGDHRLRMRVNQISDRWQASLRIRTENDGLSDVVGLPGD